MTRKKFVKQLMALGVSRNRANALAYACQVAGEPYAVYYRRELPWWTLARAARMARAAMLNMSKAFSGLIPVARELAAALVVHHAQPITPENLEGGKLYVVTKQEHDRLHGYSANVCFADENHPAPRHDDALDALSYAAVIAGRGNGRSDMALTERDFVEITQTAPPAEFSTRYMGRWEIPTEGGGQE